MLEPHTAPQIELDDLAGAVLTLAAWGASTCESIAALPWLSPPPSHSLAEARDLLRGLGAVGDEGITAHGQALVRLPLHPRLGHMLLAAVRTNECECSNGSRLLQTNLTTEDNRN